MGFHAAVLARSRFSEPTVLNMNMALLAALRPRAGSNSSTYEGNT
jgi:hypothetical protein